MQSLFSSSDDISKTQESNANDNDSINYDDLSRRDVRSLIFHFLYAAHAFNYEESVQSIIDNVNRGFELNVPLNGEIAHLVSSVIENRDELEKVYEPYSANWRSERISVCTKLILLFAIWEFKYTTIDLRIIINEAIELAKCFAEEDAYRFVNGILDSVSKEFRR